MTITVVFCSQIILQNSGKLPCMGPCVPTYALGFRNPSMKLAFMYPSVNDPVLLLLESIAFLEIVFWLPLFNK